LNGEGPYTIDRGPAAGVPVWAVGLMSGTSLDGVDVALVQTDGETLTEVGPALMLAYDEAFRKRLHALIRGRADDTERATVERELTERHWMAVGSLVRRWHDGDPRDVRVIGFHGQTLWHRPEEHQTCQIGDGALLARLSAAPVINDFRSADMAAGGEGAPLAPLYHVARVKASDIAAPVAILNIGGVANVTWVGPGDLPLEDRVLAFDTGPGGALIDDWALMHTGRACDVDGRLAAAGTADEAVVAQMMAHPYFDRLPPKSLDRLSFETPLGGLGIENGAATLTTFTVWSIARAAEFFPAPVTRWLVTGGGRHNPVLMAGLAETLGMPVDAVEEVGWNGDALEAEAFAYLAVRALRGLPLSLPKTTGARRAVTGGRLFMPETSGG
jgi:anhydro-N-acetylmuramic acid kinase